MLPPKTSISSNSRTTTKATEATPPFVIFAHNKMVLIRHDDLKIIHNYYRVDEKQLPLHNPFLSVGIIALASTKIVMTAIATPSISTTTISRSNITKKIILWCEQLYSTRFRLRHPSPLSQEQRRLDFLVSPGLKQNDHDFA